MSIHEVTAFSSRHPKEWGVEPLRPSFEEGGLKSATESHPKLSDQIYSLLKPNNILDSTKWVMAGGVLGAGFTLAAETIASRYGLGDVATGLFAALLDDGGTNFAMNVWQEGKVDLNKLKEQVVGGLANRAVMHGLMMAGLGLMLPWPMQMAVMVGNMVVGDQVSKIFTHEVFGTGENPLEHLSLESLSFNFVSTAMMAGLSHVLPVGHLMSAIVPRKLSVKNLHASSSMDGPWRHFTELEQFSQISKQEIYDEARKVLGKNPEPGDCVVLIGRVSQKHAVTLPPTCVTRAKAKEYPSGCFKVPLLYLKEGRRWTIEESRAIGVKVNEVILALECGTAATRTRAEKRSAQAVWTHFKKIRDMRTLNSSAITTAFTALTGKPPIGGDKSVLIGHVYPGSDCTQERTQLMGKVYLRIPRQTLDCTPSHFQIHMTYQQYVGWKITKGSKGTGKNAVIGCLRAFWVEK